MTTARHTLSGSTLSEMLVTMIVTAIIFLSVMQGLTLFTRLQIQRTALLTANSRFAEGYYRLEKLVSGADSIVGREGQLTVWQGRSQIALQMRDTVLLVHSGAFCDTLLTGITALRNVESAGNTPDTVEVLLSHPHPFAIRFAVRVSAAENYRITIDSIEQQYGYTE